MEYDKYLDILREELVPALGCTEPIALAFAAAKCREVLGQDAQQIEALCSGNIVKNVKGVVVPNCEGLKGIDTAVVAGMIGGDADRGLEVLTTVTGDDMVRVRDYLKSNPVDVKLLATEAKLHFIIVMKADGHRAEVEIKNEHTNIIRIEKDGEILFSCDSDDECESELSDRSFLSVQNIVEFAETVDVKLLEPIIRPQIVDNLQICKEGLEHQWGACVGRTVLDCNIAGHMSMAEAMAAAGSDARMSGCSKPVVINSGSGNQGITVSIPVIEYVREHGIEDEKLLRALAISNLLAIHQKSFIGRLSAYCGAVCAACGAGAAITWLAGGSINQIEETMTNTLATISGMVCDGAKPSCAGKIAVAVNAALIAHRMAMLNRSYAAGDGIVKDDIEKTVSSVGILASQGMRDTDSVILNVMLDK